MTLWNDPPNGAPKVNNADRIALSQSRASEQGREFESLVVSHLTFRGWRIEARRVHLEGLTEVDIIAVDPFGVLWWIECKGSYDRQETAGLRRGDSVKKAVGSAWFLKWVMPEHPPYMLVVSHLPKPESVGARILDAAKAAALFDKVVTLDDLNI